MASHERSTPQSHQSSDSNSAHMWEGQDGENEDEEDLAGKHLRMLSFSHPGKFMDNFDPERSTREMRKMNRRIYRENRRKNQLYDETGRLIENSRDLCDCLEMECPGCHYPCNRCGSPKCATECRCNRKFIFEHVEVEGTILVIKWPESITPVKT